MPGRYFIVSISESNWLVVKRENIYGVPETARKAPRELVKPDDYLIFYVSKKASEKLGGKIVGVYRVVSDWFEGRELLWPDEVGQGRLIYKWRVKIEPVKLGTVEFREIVPRLSFIKNKQRWSAYLVGTPGNAGKPIPAEDAELIMKMMK